MTKNGCLSPQEIGDLLLLPAGSPAREHAEACPRCSALLLTYREFVEDRSVPPGADLKNAERSLRGAFAGASQGGRRTIRSVAGAHTRWGALPRWVGRETWLLVPAALVLAVGLYVGFERLGKDDGEDRLRGPMPTGADGAASTLALLGSFPLGDGGVELRWRSVATATSYDIAIFGTDLKDMAQLGVASDTVCVLRRSDLRPEPEAAALLGWQVTARRGGAILSRSTIASLRLP